MKQLCEYKMIYTIQDLLVAESYLALNMYLRTNYIGNKTTWKEVD
jgi:hypothetical protein